MKKKLFAISALVIALTIIGTGTLAYFTAGNMAHNVITSGEIDIELVETMKDGKTEVPYPEDPVSGIMPGTPHSKIVRVENVGSNPAWVRIRVDVAVKAADGDDLGADKLRIDFDTDKWTYDGGWYYYREVLAPGAKTRPLFETVEFDASMDNDYQNASISIEVKAHGIQYQNNEIPEGGDITDVWPSGIPILPLI